MIKFCSLFSSSSGNCTFISSGNTKVLVDIGVSCKCVERELYEINEGADEIQAIFITHEHTDHVRGAEVFVKKYGADIYATKETWNQMKYLQSSIPYQNIKIIEKGRIEPLGDIGVKAFSIPHDAVDPVGFSFFIGEKKITTATDFGHISSEIEANMSGSAAVLLESNHDVSMLKSGPYPYHLKQRILSDYGHLSNDNCAKLVLKLIKQGTAKFLLGHLSAENNRPYLAYNASCNMLESAGVRVGYDVLLHVAGKSSVGSEITV